jgi:hypothetical protein
MDFDGDFLEKQIVPTFFLSLMYIYTLFLSIVTIGFHQDCVLDQNIFSFYLIWC